MGDPQVRSAAHAGPRKFDPEKPFDYFTPAEKFATMLFSTFLGIVGADHALDLANGSIAAHEGMLRSRVNEQCGLQLSEEQWHALGRAEIWRKIRAENTLSFSSTLWRAKSEIGLYSLGSLVALLSVNKGLAILEKATGSNGYYGTLATIAVALALSVVSYGAFFHPTQYHLAPMPMFNPHGAVCNEARRIIAKSEKPQAETEESLAASEFLFSPEYDLSSAAVSALGAAYFSAPLIIKAASPAPAVAGSSTGLLAACGSAAAFLIGLIVINPELYLRNKRDASEAL